MQCVSKHASSKNDLRCAAKCLPRAAASVSRSGRKPQSTRGVHPLHKCSVQGFWEISSRMQKKKKERRKERNTVSWPHVGWYLKTQDRKKQPCNGNSCLWAETPLSDTKTAFPLSAGLFPCLLCLFICRHHAHGLHATRFHSLSSELDPTFLQNK